MGMMFALGPSFPCSVYVYSAVAPHQHDCRWHRWVPSSRFALGEHHEFSYETLRDLAGVAWQHSGDGDLGRHRRLSLLTQEAI